LNNVGELDDVVKRPGDWTRRQLYTKSITLGEFTFL
jgi:hypothetical protein